MDISLLIRHRLKQLGLEQKDLAIAADVTESYVSQLLTRKKAPPAPGRTDIYEKIGTFLRLPNGELADLAASQRKEEMKKKAADPSSPLFKECRDLVLRKCVPEQKSEIRRIFEKEPFGELERLITQTLLNVAQGIAKEELENQAWQRRLARRSHRSYEQSRVATLEFLDTDVFDISLDSCISFLDPMIDSWQIDLKSFAIDIALNRRLTAASQRRFEFSEQLPLQPYILEAGLQEFLKDSSLSSDATAEEIEFLKALKFRGRRPSALYYYRELQSLRDPLHFLPNESGAMIA